MYAMSSLSFRIQPCLKPFHFGDRRQLSRLLTKNGPHGPMVSSAERCQSMTPCCRTKAGFHFQLWLIQRTILPPSSVKICMQQAVRLLRLGDRNNHKLNDMNEWTWYMTWMEDIQWLAMHIMQHKSQTYKALKSTAWALSAKLHIWMSTYSLLGS